MTSGNIQTPARYPSDLSNEEWALIEPIFNELEPYTTGRRRESNLREILNAVFYLNKTGCPWRYYRKILHLVNYFYNKWTHSGLLEQINAALRARLREKAGRNPDPSAAIIDSQSVKGTPESSIDAGFDGGKLVKGRKRHIDTMGCLLVVWVHAAKIFDGKAARHVIVRLFLLVQSIKLMWADGAYSGHELFDWALSEFNLTLEVVKRQ